MAIWQYNFLVLPHTNIDEEIKTIDEFDDSIFWKKQNIQYHFFDDIEKLLKKTNSWSTNLIIYGNTESNCFEVYCDGQDVISVSFRIDFRTNYESLMYKLLDFIIFKGLMILDEELNIVFLNFETIKSTIETSPQFRKYRTLSNNQ